MEHITRTECHQRNKLQGNNFIQTTSREYEEGKEEHKAGDMQILPPRNIKFQEYSYKYVIDICVIDLHCPTEKYNTEKCHKLLLKRSIF